ncbi:hypothetical protein CCACVL1_06297 [Corchorus capsularis]|uniref:Uncharacterized protein n=1 Tax=Corchorus capsularis TaxID=210143 RepID=A0A1R3JGC3_COCAP|nr:hypothetical protein CCACVL1_06297 [Corchorus capsularis]
METPCKNSLCSNTSYSARSRLDSLQQQRHHHLPSLQSSSPVSESLPTPTVILQLSAFKCYE